jgi:hypothetical protein
MIWIWLAVALISIDWLRMAWQLDKEEKENTMTWAESKRIDPK